MWVNATDASCYEFNFWPHTNRPMLLKKHQVRQLYRKEYRTFKS